MSDCRITACANPHAKPKSTVKMDEQAKRARNAKKGGSGQSRLVGKPIYAPKGLAREYADFALNVYTGCTHGCEYCYAPRVLRKSRDEFRSAVAPRGGIVEATEKQLSKGGFKGKTIHLCFTCDPYPSGIDTSPTREIVAAVKAAGAHVQILTKNGVGARRDFDLLDANDWFGVTVSGGDEFEPNANSDPERICALREAHSLGIKTWVSCEPVFDVRKIYDLIRRGWFVDLFKLGKLNYAESDIDWAAFRRDCERLCKEFGRSYAIKSSLRGFGGNDER